MYDNRTAGELNITAWNEVRGVVRKYDYLDIKNGLKHELLELMTAKLAELEITFLSRIKNSSEITTLRQKMTEIKTCNVEWAVNLFQLDFPLEDYKVALQACDICQSFNGLYNRVREYDKGTLLSVFITQSELYSVHWLRQNKPRLKDLVHQQYKHLVDKAKIERGDK